MPKPRVEPTNDVRCGMVHLFVINHIYCCVAKMQPKIAATTKLGATVSWKIKRKCFLKISKRFMLTQNASWCCADETTVLHYTLPFLSSSFKFFKIEKIIIIIISGVVVDIIQVATLRLRKLSRKTYGSILFFAAATLLLRFVLAFGHKYIIVFAKRKWYWTYHHLFYEGDYEP